MTGDDKARFCKSCRKNVYNLTLMTRHEAEALIQAKEGNLCVRFARRADGTVITNDCPVGAAAPQNIWRPWLFARQFAAATLAALAAFVTGSRVMAQPPLDKTSGQNVFQCIKDDSHTSAVMGRMVAPRVPPTIPVPAEAASTQTIVIIRGTEKAPIIPSTPGVRPKVMQVIPRSSKPLPKVIR
jgi:hypothetical protein